MVFVEGVLDNGGAVKFQDIAQRIITVQIMLITLCDGFATS